MSSGLDSLYKESTNEIRVRVLQVCSMHVGKLGDKSLITATNNCNAKLRKFTHIINIKCTLDVNKECVGTILGNCAITISRNCTLSINKRCTSLLPISAHMISTGSVLYLVARSVLHCLQEVC